MLTSSLSIVSPAGAQAPMPPPAPAPTVAPAAPVPPGPPAAGYYYPTPPPPLPPPTASGAKLGVHEHEGFFLRMGLGFSSMLTKTEGTLGQPDPGGDFSGNGGALELLLGGTPARGFVIGGGLVLHSWPEPSYDNGGTRTRLNGAQLGSSFLALFGQLYFDRTSGGYVQALVAGAEQTYRYEEAGETKEAGLSGFALALGGGYDFWVGEEWSLGPELRLSYARVEHEDAGVTTRHRTLALTLSFSATLH